ncbi:MAG: hypothetical protein C0597_03315 [Marinilabiliales bacterium]|nr:MAG: hypothetical protein C0597_03315 [Marinilabiliales bacterium]
MKLKQGIIIVDEITTGLGRTGKWFGYNHFNLKPDIVVLGKSLGNGYPVSAVIIDNWMIKKNEESGFMHYQSHQNDPLGCKIAEGVLNEIREENLVQNSKELGFLFLNILKEELEPISSIEDIRGIGLLIGIQVKPDIKVEDIYNNLAKKGIIIGISITYNMLNIVPPYTMDKELIPTIAGKIKESIFETITN